MVDRLEVTFDTKRFRRALRRAPDVLERHVDRAIGRSVREMARTARRLAPKATSQLTNSILSRQPSPLEGLVRAGVDYAPMVETGTGPGGRPPQRAMLTWLRLHQIQPHDPGMSDEDLAFVMARAIVRHGTPAQPFMAPAFRRHEADARQRIDAAVSASLNEIARR